LPAARGPGARPRSPEKESARSQCLLSEIEATATLPRPAWMVDFAAAPGGRWGTETLKLPGGASGSTRTLCLRTWTKRSLARRRRTGHNPPNTRCPAPKRMACHYFLRHDKSHREVCMRRRAAQLPECCQSADSVGACWGRSSCLNFCS